MTQIEFLAKTVFFTTRQYAFALGIALETASRQLKILAIEKSLQSVTRGVWAHIHHPYYSPYGAAPYLLGNEHGYISFLTALHRHGVISQIPKTIQIATTGRGRKLKSAIGEFEFFHIQSQMMGEGIQVNEGKLPYNIATAEKAFLDTLYLSTRKGRRFAKLPEIDRESLQARELNRITRSLSPSVQNLIRPKLKDVS